MSSLSTTQTSDRHHTFCVTIYLLGVLCWLYPVHRVGYPRIGTIKGRVENLYSPLHSVTIYPKPEVPHRQP